MNILFLTLVDIRSIDERGIYSDLMREFARNNHSVYIVSPVERRYNIQSHIIEYHNSDDWHKNVHILKLKTGNIQKTNVVEKGISTLSIEYLMKFVIIRYFKKINFDLVLYSTPPITLVSPVKYIKKRDNAKSYLMLKDIFPQNAVDLGMMETVGLTGIIYKYFRNKEKQLYKISDKIGCMSQANVDYILQHNKYIESSKVEICPNAIEPIKIRLTKNERDSIRRKYNLPLDKKIFVYGGNLGKPQGIPFVLECLDKNKENSNIFFLIVGNGTEYIKLEKYINMNTPKNVKLLKFIEKNEYDQLVSACDVGLIFLDYRFTIPNFPSRILSYMQAGLPILAATDRASDVGHVIKIGGFGWWCPSNDVNRFTELVDEICNEDLIKFGNNSTLYLREFDVKKTGDTILRS